jgi:hypothetical protein
LGVVSVIAGSAAPSAGGWFSAAMHGAEAAQTPMTKAMVLNSWVIIFALLHGCASRFAPSPFPKPRFISYFR